MSEFFLWQSNEVFIDFFINLFMSEGLCKIFMNLLGNSDLNISNEKKFTKDVKRFSAF